MSDTLSNITDNLAEENNKNQCKDFIGKCLKCMEKNCKNKYTDCKWYLEYAEIKV